MSYNPNIISSEYYPSPQDTQYNKSTAPVYDSYIPQYMPNNNTVHNSGSYIPSAQYAPNNNQSAANNNHYAPTKQFSYNPNIPLDNMPYNMPYTPYNKKYESFTPDSKISKSNWITFGKKIVIYTILFLIMSHVKMNCFVCSFMPFLNNNEVLCMTIKGLIMSILIIIIQKLL